MVDDIFDDERVRLALERSLGVRARAWGEVLDPALWYFERVRYGMRRLEIGPLGLYSATAVGEPRFEALRRFIDEAPNSALTSVRVNLNPLEVRADELIQGAKACNYRVVQNQTHIVPIGASIEATRREYHATKRHQVQREGKARSRIVVASNASHIDDYVEVYAASLKRWGRAGFVYPPALFSALLESPSTRIWMNYVEDRLACAMVVFQCRSYALYWQGVSRIDDDQKSAHPMVKLMDAVLQDLIRSGISQFNLGASDGLPNVQRFKEEFGARPVAYASLVYESPLWRGLARARQAWRKTVA